MGGAPRWFSPSSLPVLLVTQSPSQSCVLFSLCITFSRRVSLSMRSLLFLYLPSFCLCLFSAVSSSPRLFSCAPPISPLVNFCFLSSAPSSPSFPSPCHLLPIRQILHVAKEKKREKKIKTQKSQNKNESRVCCQVPRPPGGLCVRPRGPQPARLPPARLPCVLPACPPAPPANDTEFSAWVSGDGY